MKKQAKQSTQELYEQVRTLLELSEAVVRDSGAIPDDQKRIYLDEYRTNEDEAKTFASQNNASFLRQLQKEILTPWNETNDADSQKFWKLVRDKGLGIEQTDYLTKILQRGRITNPTEYELVQDSLVIWQQEGRISAEQAAKLHHMLSEYEQKQT